MPEANLENVRQVMINIGELVDKGAQVALPTNSVTPACTQSITFDAAANAGVIQPLQEFTYIAATPEPEVSADAELLRILQIKQTSWRNAPALRDGIKRWVEKTVGVVIGESGPELQLQWKLFPKLRKIIAIATKKENRHFNSRKIFLEQI